MTTQDTLVQIQRNLDTSVLRPVNVNHNISSSPPTLDIIVKDFSPLVVNMDMGREQELKCENGVGVATTARPRVGSTARRTALGWSKRSNGKSSTDRKENAVGKENTGHGNLMT
jgi:serine/arginine repetitive matrix protein 2